MCSRGATLSAMLLLALGTAAAADDPAVESAKAAALSWLALADQGNATLTWQAAAPIFRKALDRDRWQIALTATRAPLGKLKSRDLVAATPAKSLPGVPDGDYVVIQYHAVFEFKADATETVTPQRDAEGRWRVAGYYIQ